MADKTIGELIDDRIKTISNNNPPPEPAKIIKVYDNNHADVQTNKHTIRYIECIGNPTNNNKGIIIYKNGDPNQPLLITHTTSQSINAVGYFTINNDGHLIVELPDGYTNPYSINSSGHLIYDTSATEE